MVMLSSEAYQLLLLLLIAIHVPSGGSGAAGVEKEDENVIYMEDTDDMVEFALLRLQKIIRIYNFSQSMEDKYHRLRSLNPYAEANAKISSLIKQLHAHSIQFTDVRKLLARQATRDPGRRHFERLWWQSEALGAEAEEAIRLVKIVEHRERNERTEEALQLQEALREDAHNISGVSGLINELGTAVSDLVAQKLLPEPLLSFDEDERFVNALPKIDMEALQGLVALFEEGSALEDRIADAFLAEEAEEMEIVGELDEELNTLMEKRIPVYLEEHKRSLRRVFLITLHNLEFLEERIKKLDVEASILGAQDAVMGKVYEELGTEFKEYSEARKGAEGIYKKYFDLEALRKSPPPPPTPTPESHDEL